MIYSEPNPTQSNHEVTTMNQTNNSATATSASSSARLTEFESEVDKLSLTGGKANLERRYMRLGILVAVVGLVLTLVAYFTSDSAEDWRDQIDMVIFAIFGVGLIILGGVFMAVNAVTRFLRYWLVRLIYELREQTDNISRNP